MKTSKPRNNKKDKTRAEKMQRREAQKIRTIQDINNDRSSTYYDDETDSDDEYYAKKKLDSEFKQTIEIWKRKLKTPQIMGKIIAWILGLFLFTYAEFGVIYLLLSMILFMYLNTNESKDETKSEGQLSAYSVFNKGFKRLTGDRDSGPIDKQLLF